MAHLVVPTPPDFRFWSTVSSHGWCALKPFGYDDPTQTLTRIERLRDRTLAHLTITAANGSSALAVHVAGPARLAPDQAGDIRQMVARCLSIDHDLSEFYAIARALPAYQWVEAAGGGRMLVSPTVWEDLAKTLLTTNTTWRMTKDMVSRLVTLGEPAGDGQHAFPTPEAIAALNPDALNAHVRAGYRGAYLHALAVDIASGRLDAEALRDPTLSGKEVYRQLLALKGFGPYAAGAMMRLLGHFDELGLDSVCRTMFRDRWNNGVAPTDRQIAEHYAPFGRWRGLAVWMDVMREDIDAATRNRQSL